jgi:hypothetical protein
MKQIGRSWSTLPKASISRQIVTSQVGHQAVQLVVERASISRVTAPDRRSRRGRLRQAAPPWNTSAESWFGQLSIQRRNASPPGSRTPLRAASRI